MRAWTIKKNKKYRSFDGSFSNKLWRAELWDSPKYWESLLYEGEKVVEIEIKEIREKKNA